MPREAGRLFLLSRFWFFQAGVGVINNNNNQWPRVKCGQTSESRGCLDRSPDRAIEEIRVDSSNPTCHVPSCSVPTRRFLIDYCGNEEIAFHVLSFFARPRKETFFPQR